MLTEVIIPVGMTEVNYGGPVELDDLLDAAEVAGLLGLASFRVVSVYRRRYTDFPPPVVEKGRCVLWNRADIERWARETGRAK